MIAENLPRPVPLILAMAVATILAWTVVSRVALDRYSLAVMRGSFSLGHARDDGNLAGSSDRFSPAHRSLLNASNDWLLHPDNRASELRPQALTMRTDDCVLAQGARTSTAHSPHSAEEARRSGADEGVSGDPVVHVLLAFQEESLDYGIYLPVVNRSGHETYYVSKMGDNTDAGSWATAWNELDQINWSVVQPGDTILIDGGPIACAFPVPVTGASNTPRSTSGGECGMVYQSTLTVGRSGEPGNPITIRLAEEPGRNGTVRIFGGRSTPLPYCGQTDYIWQTSAVRNSGVFLDQRNWVVIDGVKWSGMMIYGHNRHGVELYRAYADDTYPVPEYITIRNIELYDNGDAHEHVDGWEPDLAGVELTGTQITFERAIIHDNGQDAFQSSGGIGSFALRQSWLYSGRRNATMVEPFNYCRHPDGIQIYDGGSQAGLLIEESIIGPGLMQGVILGQRFVLPGVYAAVHDVTLRHVLFMKAGSANIMGYPGVKSEGWLIDHVTAHCPDGCESNLFLEGSGHAVQNSIFEGGAIYLPDGLDVISGNCQWNTRGFRLGRRADPLFIDADDSNLFSLDDYALTPDSPCAGQGSGITSVAKLLAQPDARSVQNGSLDKP